MAMSIAFQFAWALKLKLLNVAVELLVRRFHVRKNLGSILRPVAGCPHLTVFFLSPFMTMGRRQDTSWPLLPHALKSVIHNYPLIRRYVAYAAE